MATKSVHRSGVRVQKSTKWQLLTFSFLIYLNEGGALTFFGLPNHGRFIPYKFDSHNYFD